MSPDGDWRTEYVPVPIPVPVYIPVPMHMYSQSIPVPTTVPVPVSHTAGPPRPIPNVWAQGARMRLGCF